MHRWPTLVLLLAAGCTVREQAALVPRLVLRGALVQRVDGDDASRDWRVQGTLQWRAPAGASRVDVPRAPPSLPAARSRVPCANERLCAWERREVARAEAEVLRRFGREGRP